MCTTYEVWPRKNE